MKKCRFLDKTIANMYPLACPEMRVQAVDEAAVVDARVRWLDQVASLAVLVEPIN